MIPSTKDPLYQTKITCCTCGKEETLHWNSEVNACLNEGKLCFTCDFWLEKLTIKDDPETVRAGGQHFHIGKDDRKFPFRGFGGAKFKIRFHDGRYVESKNVWTQGDIPDRFKHLLPDNAVIVR